MIIEEVTTEAAHALLGCLPILTPASLTDFFKTGLKIRKPN
jgi:hypothetical protein